MTSDTTPLRVVLLAPLVVVGGISTWTRCLMKYTDKTKVIYRVIETSKRFAPQGKALGIIGSILGIRDAILRSIHLIWAIIFFRPNVVHFTCAPSIGFLARDVPYLLLLRILRVRSIVHIHGGDVPRFFGRNFLSRFIVRYATRWATAILVMTPDMEVKSRELFGPHKVVYVPNMIDDDKVIPTLDRKAREATDSRPAKLIHVAWQAPAKGSLEVVESMAVIKSPATCDLAGTVSDGNRRLIEGLAADRNATARVRLLGCQHGSDLHRTFLEADLFVFPSHTEGFPNVILEAMAYGLPIIATEVGNIREMIGADTPAPAGVLLSTVPADPTELAAKIDLLLADPELRQRLANNGRARIGQYLATRLVPELETFLCDLCRSDPRTIAMHRWGHCAHIDNDTPMAT